MSIFSVPVDIIRGVPPCEAAESNLTGDHRQCAVPLQPKNFRSRQAGVGLIEILIAVLVLSIGFLGIAALLANSMATNNSAMARSMATISSYSILDAMRADLINARGGAYNGTVTASSCPAAGTASLAAWQLNQWCIQLGDKLGAVSTTTGAIKCVGSAGDCKITIQFDDSRAGKGGSTTQTITTEAML